MTSKAQRKRRKGRAKAKTTLSDGTVIPQVVPNDPRRPKAEDARKATLQARLRTAGIPITPDSLKAAVAPDYGHDVGLCIRHTIKGDDATKAWDTFTHISASYRNYMVYFIGQTGNAKTAAIAMIPEPMETDQSLRVDLRTHDEKVSAAKSSWAAWEKRMADLPIPQMRWALGGTLRGFLGDGTLWMDGKPTHTGQTVVAALKAMGA